MDLFKQNIMFSDFKLICRLCLNREIELNSIFMNETPFHQMITIILGLNVCKLNKNYSNSLLI